MASTTVHRFPSDGELVRRGIASVANGQTVSTGLSLVNGFLATPTTADTQVATMGVSAGDVTVSIQTAGAPNAVAQTIYWKAWITPQRV